MSTMFTQLGVSYSGIEILKPDPIYKLEKKGSHFNWGYNLQEHKNLDENDDEYRFYACYDHTNIALFSPFDTSIEKIEDRYRIVIPFTEFEKGSFGIKPFGLFNDGKILVGISLCELHLFEPSAEGYYPELDVKTYSPH